MFRLSRLAPWTGALLLTVGALLASVVVTGTAVSAQDAWTPATALTTLPNGSQFNDLSGATIAGDGVLWSVDNKRNEVIGWQASGSGWARCWVTCWPALRSALWRRL